MSKKVEMLSRLGMAVNLKTARDTICFWYAGCEQPGEILRRHRPAEIVPLRLVTLVSLKKSQLFSRFHALRDDPQLETAGHADHRGHDARIVLGGGDVTDE